jgi:hypothetical protein
MPKDRDFLDACELSSERTSTELTQYLETLSRQLVQALNERQYDAPVFKHFAEVSSKVDTKTGTQTLSDRIEEVKRVSATNPNYGITVKDVSSFVNASEDVVDVLLVGEVTERVGIQVESIGILRWKKGKSDPEWKCKETTYMRGHPSMEGLS